MKNSLILIFTLLCLKLLGAVSYYGTFTGDGSGLTNLNASITVNDTTNAASSGTFTNGAVVINLKTNTSSGGGVTTNLTISYSATTNAVAFCVAHGVKDKNAFDDACKYVTAIESASGTNFNSFWNDLFIASPRYNALAGKTWKGAAVVMSNVTLTARSLLLSNGVVSLNFSSIPPSNTLVLVFAGVPGWNSVEQLFYLSDGTTNNAYEDWMNEYENSFYSISGTNSLPNAVYFENNLTNVLTDAYNGQLLVSEMWNRQEIYISNDGHGNLSFWADGIPVNWANTTSNIMPFAALTNLNTLTFGAPWMGKELNQPSFPGSYPNGRPNGFHGELALSGMANFPMTTNLALALKRANRKLEASPVNRFYIGDSRMTPSFSGADVPYGKGADVIAFYEASNPDKTDWNIFLSVQNGAKTWNALTWATNILANVYTDDKVTYNEMFYGMGINDIYGDGNNAPAIYTNYVAPFCRMMTNDRIYAITLMTVATNGSIYNFFPPYETNRNNFNGILRTNVDGLFAAVVDPDSWINQGVIRVGSSNTVDGLHFTYSTSSPGAALVCQQLAYQMWTASGHGNRPLQFPLTSGFQINQGTTNASVLTSFTAVFQNAFSDTNYTATETGNGFSIASSYVSSKTTTNCVFNMTAATGLIDWIAIHP